jgi:NADH-quinone oxidoreductase subunit G
MRLKPRHNPDVNDYWICDQGRYNYHFIDENRIQHPQLKDDLISWDLAIGTIVTALKELKNSKLTHRIGVLASKSLTNEDLYVIRKFFLETLRGAHVDFKIPEKPGDSDDFLIKADKNPNTVGALAILPADADAQQIVQKALQGEIDLLYVFGHDLVKLFGKGVVEQLAGKVKLFVYQGSNVNETCSYVHLNLPSSVYAEKDGTFTNCQGKVQRIWPAFLPIAEAKADWEIISMLSSKLGTPMAYLHSQEIFNDLAATLSPFSEMTYEKIGDKGMILKGFDSSDPMGVLNRE